MVIDIDDLEVVILLSENGIEIVFVAIILNVIVSKNDHTQRQLL